jgi:hypothetical protein
MKFVIFFKVVQIVGTLLNEKKSQHMLMSLK